MMTKRTARITIDITLGLVMILIVSVAFNLSPVDTGQHEVVKLPNYDVVLHSDGKQFCGGFFSPVDLTDSETAFYGAPIWKDGKLYVSLDNPSKMQFQLALEKPAAERNNGRNRAYVDCSLFPSYSPHQ